MADTSLQPADYNVTDSFQALLSDLLLEPDHITYTPASSQAASSQAGSSSTFSAGCYDGYISSAPSEDIYSPSGSRAISPLADFAFSTTPPENSKHCNKSTEQRRRSQINTSFTTLHQLVPGLSRESTTSKVGKAVVLTKTCDYISKLRSERENMQQEADKLQEEINQLNKSISDHQAMLPETGVVATPVNTNYADKQKLDEYIDQRTGENFKFDIFSRFMRPLFDSYQKEVGGCSLRDLHQNTEQWIEKDCTLPTLRPVALNSLRGLALETSILTDPPKLEQEIQNSLTARKNSSSHDCDPIFTSTSPS